MNEAPKDAAAILVEIDLDEEQLARLDELIEEHSTPSHRMTREEVLLMLVDKGRELVAQGESLLPFLEPPTDETAPDPGNTTKH
jgi:hypothetical protein